MGAISCLSFDPTKVVGSFSSAGAVVTDDPDLARKVVQQRYHGRDSQTREYEALGYNSQLSSEMAAMLVFKLSKMAEWESQRARIAKIYQEGLADVAQIQLPSLAPGSTHNWHKFVIRAAGSRWPGRRFKDIRRSDDGALSKSNVRHARVR